MDDLPPKLRSFRPRFSLLTILLLTTIAALLLVIWRQWANDGPLRAETKRWRDETVRLREESGVFTVEDPTKVYARALTSLEEKTWRWRIFLPAGRKFTFHVRDGQADLGKVYSTGGNGSSIEFPSDTTQSHEFLLAAGIRKSDSGRLMLTVQSDAIVCSMALPVGAENWSGWQTAGVGKSTVILDPDKPLEIFRLIGGAGATSSNDPGVAIFMTPIKPEPADTSTSGSKNNGE